MRDEYAPFLTVRRTQQILRATPDLCWARAVTAPPLSKKQRQRRFRWCRHNVKKGSSFWRSIIWSDEKLWRLDGPDGLRSYWHDKRAAKRWHSTRQASGGGVVVWEAVSEEAKSNLVSINERFNAKRYTKLLEESLVPIMNTQTCRTIFQHDRAPPHTALHAQKWIEEKAISEVPWPSRSPDLNPIENVWSALSHAVYENAQHYDNVKDLRQAILEVWDNIEINYIRSLVRSMSERCLKVVEARSGQSDY